SFGLPTIALCETLALSAFGETDFATRSPACRDEASHRRAKSGGGRGIRTPRYASGYSGFQRSPPSTTRPTLRARSFHSRLGPPQFLGFSVIPQGPALG